MEILWGAIGTAITLLGVIYGIYENRRRVKLENYNREQAWEIYRQAVTVLGFYQKISGLKINNPEHIRLESAGGQVAIELTVNSIRMIKRFEKKYDEEQIQKWLTQGKIPNDTHLKTFRDFV